jgi:hypothetical protein
MIMADVLKIALLIVGAMMVFICYWLAAEALFPTVVERARSQYHSHALKITLIGLAAMAPLLGIGVLIGRAPHPLAKMLSVAIISAPVLLGLLGSAGLSQRIGFGLPSVTDEQQPWRRTLRGGIVLVFLFLLPFIGWFILLPWTVISGLGASLLSFARKPAPAEAVPPLIGANEVAG